MTGSLRGRQLSSQNLPGPGGSADHGQDLRPVKPPESGTPGHSEARLQLGLSGERGEDRSRVDLGAPAASQGAP